MNADARALVAALRSIARSLWCPAGIGFYVPNSGNLVQIDAVMDGADELVAAVRSIACTLPGSTGIGFYVFGTCDFVQITVSTDPDVYVLGHALGLESYDLRISEGEERWWLHAASRGERAEGYGDFAGLAASQGERGERWIDLAGPHHEGPPPGRAHAARRSAAGSAMSHQDGAASVWPFSTSRLRASRTHGR